MKESEVPSIEDTRHYRANESGDPTLKAFVLVSCSAAAITASPLGNCNHTMRLIAS